MGEHEVALSGSLAVLWMIDGEHLPTIAFSRPRSRYVDPLWRELALFEMKPVNPSP